MEFWTQLAAEGASPEDIATVVRLLGLVACDGAIGHRVDFDRASLDDAPPKRKSAA